MTSEKAALVDDVEAGGRGGGDATFGMTVITLMKICVGTGVLAVPHAFSGAGVVPGFGMLFALLCWNDWSANRLLACRDLLSDDERRRFEAPGGESPLGALARVVAGPRVATSVEVCLCVLMFGVATAYFVALHDFLAATPLGPALARAPRGVDTFAAACLALPLSLVDDIGALAYAGAAGLCAIFVSFACIVTYGVEERTAVGWAQADGFTWMTPTSVSALASGFGVLAFCFGVAPLALQLEASMAEPRRFASAQRYALGVAFLAYAATGAGVARLYDGLPCAPDGVAGNVLDDLPRGAPWTTAPSAVRVAMSVVCVFSAPIGVVSSGEILEAALPPLAPGRRPLFLRRLAVRGGVAFGAATVAAAVPVFALIVALVGCLAVSFLSFVLPPYLHLKLALSREPAAVALDAAATVLGVVVVVFTTSLTALTTAAEVARAAAPPPVVQSG